MIKSSKKNNNKITINSDKNYIRSLFKIASEKKNESKLNWSIRGNIFISGKHTYLMTNKIENENWGTHQHQLYHYLDYTFRIRVMKNEMNVYTFNNNNNKIAVFHTGLKLKNSDRALYLLCKPNTHAKKNPKWAVPTDDINKIDNWFMTKDVLMKKYGILEDDLPKQVIYSNDKERLNFNIKYKCDLNWNEIFSTELSGKAKKTIIKTIKGNQCKIESKQIKKLLSKPFDDALKETLLLCKKSKGYVFPGLFIDFEKKEYLVNLMMYIQVFYEKKYHKFVVVIEKIKNKNEYKYIDLLSLKQGYYNGRYIQRLPPFWKPNRKANNNDTFYKRKIFVNFNEKCIDNNSDKEISPIILRSPSSASVVSADSSLTNGSFTLNNNDLSSIKINNNNINNKSNNNNNTNNSNDKRASNEYITNVGNQSQFISYEQYFYNPITNQNERMLVTKFINNAMNLCTELITIYPSGQYFTRVYPINNNNFVISQQNGDITSLFQNRI